MSSNLPIGRLVTYLLRERGVLLSVCYIISRMTNATMVCTDGFSTVFCLIENELCELERVEIPGWVEQFYESSDDRG